MMRFLTIIIAFVSLILPGAGVARELQDGVVKIHSIAFDRNGKITKSGSGTGFVLNDEGHVATNHHVIDGGMIFYIIREGTSVTAEDILQQPNAEVKVRDKDLDLAILQYKDPEKEVLLPVTLTTDIPSKGATVSAVGYPGAADENDMKSSNFAADATVTGGVVSRFYEGTWGDTPVEIIQHSAEVSWGNSGGPLFDACNRVIGVNTQISLSGKAFIPTKGGVIEAIAQAPGIYFASNIKELIAILDRRSISYNLAAARCKTKEEQIEGMIRLSIIGGAVAFLVLTGITLVALRRPRERIVKVVESYSKAMRRSGQNSGRIGVDQGASRQGPAPAPPPGGFVIRLDGRAEGGARYSLSLSEQELSGAGAVLGREPDAPNCAVADGSVSRRHAVLRWDGANLYVRDENSTNGTYVNGRRIASGQDTPMREGDELRLGSVRLRVSA
ncbi:MAG: trypsin-like peptidase domain-containing protein [Pseudomonadota bacterium]